MIPFSYSSTNRQSFSIACATSPSQTAMPVSWLKWFVCLLL